jgi:RNA polymerase primary sigma factor
MKYEPGAGGGEVGQFDDPVRLYLNEIGQYPLLTVEQELELGAQIAPIRDLLAANDIKIVHTPKPQILEMVRTGEISLDAGGLDMDEITLQRAFEAEQKLVNHNLRLVVSIAKTYNLTHMQLLDKIQEGNLGLMKAARKFDHTTGFKFSTYATWWIRQSITRSISDKERTIRVPAHIAELYNKINKTKRDIFAQYGREPSDDEVIERLGMDPEKYHETIGWFPDVLSMDMPLGEDGELELGDILPDKDSLGTTSDVDAKMYGREIGATLLSSIRGKHAERDRDMMSMRFGLPPYYEVHTLDAIGQKHGVSRERARQIEEKALRVVRGKLHVAAIGEAALGEAEFDGPELGLASGE